MSYQIASLFHMYIDMGERIAGKQDRFSHLVCEPRWAQSQKLNFHILHVVERIAMV